MRPKRRAEWLIAAAALLLCVGAAFVFLPERSAVDAITYGRIERGRTR